MTTSEKGDSEVQVGHNREMVFLLLVGTVLCVLTGWCWYSADTQQVLIPALLWISAVLLLVSVVITQLQLRGKTQRQEIFIEDQSDDSRGTQFTDKTLNNNTYVMYLTPMSNYL